MARSRAFRTVSRTTARRPGEAHVACGRISRPARLRSPRARPGGESCCRSCNRSSDYLASLPASDNPNAFIFPTAASAKRTGSLSNQFREILVDAGLVETARTQKHRQRALRARERQAKFRFTQLRHSAVTMLKASGVSDVIAREIVGHESAAVSRQYTHLTTDDQARRDAAVAGCDERIIETRCALHRDCIG